ncbi:heterokaryon incompatibility protein-domain-containing protein [Schizothecium vesticola]|uniref:Heterokaryon incompatibility protein-domain-containing protein n=1 Tax=Schizothecium vesticola TaxID=314040 RepID=A0AA40ELB8_9PEZI|nr:heterokaryon incompatibility protein-domain-containing protein [Schizothecium vesticola]
MASGDPNCGLCVAQSNRCWSSLPEIQGHSEDGCPYCANMLEGLLYLIPDLETKHGTDAQFRFKDGRTMHVYADPNGSLGYPSPHKPVDLEYRWFTVDTPPPSSLAYDTSSAATLSHATAWLTNCLTTHKLCNPPSPSPSAPPPLPTRILDVGPPDAPSIRLVLPPPSLSAPYIALSHSWGGTHPLTTTTVNLDAHLTSIPLSSLPPTFLHAVLLTRRLSLRHLWIDSLCILQDSPADWASEASRMAAVYRNSHLTLSATSSSSPLAGIYTPAPGGAVHIAADPPEDAETLDILFPAAAKLREELRLELRFKIVHPGLARWDVPDKEGEDSPLLTRAWAYQERLLAPRVLHFGRWEAWWECQQGLACECQGMGWGVREGKHMGTYMGAAQGEVEMPPKVSHYAALHVGGKGDKGRGKLLERWGEMVEEYTRRRLTYSADRLPAFGGVAGEMGEALGMRYLAGQWEGTLPEALMWEREEGTVGARLVWGEERPAPSWSWASVDDAVRFVIPLEGLPAWAKTKVVVEVGEVKVVPVTEDERGRVVVGESYMMVTAPMVRAAVCFEPDPHADPYVPWMEVKEGAAGKVKGPPKGRLGRASFAIKVGKVEPLMAVMDTRLCDDEGEWLWKGDGEIFCIKMMVSSETFHWLVVRKLEGEGHVYERIGLVSHPSADWKMKKGVDFSRKTIKLV